MSPLLIVIVTFGLFFVVLASLAQGFSMTSEQFRDALGAHAEVNVMLLISKFVVLPLLLIGLAAVIDFHPQVKMGIIVLALTAGAPFIPLLTGMGKGDVAYSVFASFGLVLVSLSWCHWHCPRFCACWTRERRRRSGSCCGRCCCSYSCRSQSE